MTKKIKLKKCSALLVTIILTVFVLMCSGQDVASNEINGMSDKFSYNNEFTELAGGSIVGERTLRYSNSPYIVRMDVDIQQGAKLVIEPGVVLHFAPMVGLTVRGSIIAVVSIQMFVKLKFVHILINTYRSSL